MSTEIDEWLLNEPRREISDRYRQNYDSGTRQQTEFDGMRSRDWRSLHLDIENFKKEDIEQIQTIANPAKKYRDGPSEKLTERSRLSIID